MNVNKLCFQTRWCTIGFSLSKDEAVGSVCVCMLGQWVCSIEEAT